MGTRKKSVRNEAEEDIVKEIVWPADLSEGEVSEVEINHKRQVRPIHIYADTVMDPPMPKCQPVISVVGASV